MIYFITITTEVCSTHFNHDKCGWLFPNQWFGGCFQIMSLPDDCDAICYFVFLRGWGPDPATWGSHPCQWTQHSHKHPCDGSNSCSRVHSWCSNSLFSDEMIVESCWASTPWWFWCCWLHSSCLYHRVEWEMRSDHQCTTCQDSIVHVFDEFVYVLPW